MSFGKPNGKLPDVYTSLDRGFVMPVSNPTNPYPPLEKPAPTRRRQQQRRLITIGLIATCIITLLLMLRPSRHRPVSTTHPPPDDGPPPEDHHLSNSSLVLTLNYTDASTIPSVRATLTNYHFSTKVDMLMWDSPFDDQAVALGVFTVIDRDTGRKVKPMGLKISRLLPPKSADFIELKPRHAVTKDIALTQPGITLDKGKSYDVQVRSQWKGVWHANAKHIGEKRLRLMDGPTGLIDWGYETNKLQLNVQ